MRPTSLAVRGLKCWLDRTIELGQLTAIQGPNGSGKTAFFQAIRLALMGYDPETGKQLDKTRKLISPAAEKETAEVGLSFDGGFGIRRLFGAKTETQVLPSRGESTGAQCQERINEETGGLVVALDLGTFFDLTPEKRRAWFFEHLPTGEAKLDWKTFAMWADAPAQRAEPADVLGVLGDVIRNLWEKNVQAAPNAVTGLGSAIETARREFLEADKRRHAQVEVVDRGAELLRGEKAPEPVPEDELQELDERLASANQRIGEARAGREAREAIEARVTKAEEARGELLGKLEHTEHVIRDQKEQLEALPSAPDTLDCEHALTDLEAEVDRLQGFHAEAVLRVASFKASAGNLLDHSSVQGLANYRTRLI